MTNRVWWVNHKQSHKYEIASGFMWAPKLQKDGRASQFYDNMTLVRRGDYVVSMANGLVSWIGKATDNAIPYERPPGYNSDNWNTEGWLLLVSWSTLNTKIKVKKIANDLIPYLPEKHSPLKDNGYANMAYLSEVKPGMLEAILSHIDISIVDLVFDKPSADIKELDKKHEEDEQENSTTTETSQETDAIRKSVSEARKGQGLFRERIINKFKRCPVTGVSDTTFLIASHIKGWAACKNSPTKNHDRLTENNGLLLSAHVDKLFDKGYITFSNEGKVLFSKLLPEGLLKAWGLELPLKTCALTLNEEQKKFMTWHRENFGKIHFHENQNF